MLQTKLKFLRTIVVIVWLTAGELPGRPCTKARKYIASTCKTTHLFFDDEKTLSII
jgi:hypothetical protein